jgi:type I restriction enzyme, S subunit
MSFPTYPDYADSGAEWLGRIPTHWGCELGRRLFAQSRLPAMPGDLQLSATQKYGVIPQQMFMELEDQKVVLALTGLDNFKHVEVDDFVVSLRSFQGGIERCKYSGCVSPAYTVLNARHQVDPAFMEYLLKAPPFIAALQSVTDGIREGKSISYEQFGSVHLPIPSVEEQSSISAFLTDETAKIDALVAEQEELITLLKEKRQAVISHAVTKGLDSSVPMKDSGVEWLGEVPAHWEITSLKRHWTATDCKHVTAEFVEDGIPLASIREVQSRWVELADAKRTTEHFYKVLIEGGRDPRPGDLIFSRNATVGEVAQVSVEHPLFAMGQDVVLLRRIDPSSSPDFLQQVIRSAVVIEQLAVCMIGSTFKRINVEEIRSLVIAFPPTDEQHMISTYLIEQAKQFDQLIDEAVLSIELQRERRSALISAAVTGQIDVRGLAQTFGDIAVAG